MVTSQSARDDCPSHRGKFARSLSQALLNRTIFPGLLRRYSECNLVASSRQQKTRHPRVLSTQIGQFLAGVCRGNSLTHQVTFCALHVTWALSASTKIELPLLFHIEQPGKSRDTNRDQEPATYPLERSERGVTHRYNLGNLVVARFPSFVPEELHPGKEQIQ